MSDQGQDPTQEAVEVDDPRHSRAHGTFPGEDVFPGEDPGLEARERVLKFIQSKWRGGGRCPICQEVDWTLYNTGVLPVRPPGTAVGQAGLGDINAVFPFAPLVCQNCGYTMLFHEKQARDAESETKDRGS